MTYRVGVKVTGESGWSYNAQTFATYDDAKAAGESIASRWFAVREWRVEVKDDSVWKPL